MSLIYNILATVTVVIMLGIVDMPSMSIGRTAALLLALTFYGTFCELSGKYK